jgi:hypothetical protein
VAGGIAGGEVVGLGAGLEDVGVECDRVDNGGDEAGVGSLASGLAWRSVFIAMNRPGFGGGSPVWVSHAALG